MLSNGGKQIRIRKPMHLISSASSGGLQVLLLLQHTCH